MYFRTPLPVPFQKQLLARFCTFCTVEKLQDPAAAHLLFITIAALVTKGFAENWVGCSIQDWILLLMVFGVVDLNVPSLMCECLIPTLSLTDTPAATESTSSRRSVTMNSEWERLNTLPLLLLLCQQPCGMANEATVFYKRLASRLATKWDQPYSATMSWLRCRLTFSLLRSAVQCIRGVCSSCGHAAKLPTPPMDLVVSELDFV